MLGLCRTFQCLPSALYEEDAEVIRLLEIERRGTPERKNEEVE